MSRRSKKIEKRVTLDPKFNSELIAHIIRRIRFPLHDHCKKNLKWSNAQVLMRFVLLQLVVMPILLLVLLKVR